MKHALFFLGTLLLAGALATCTYEIPEQKTPASSRGTADFGNYVAIGNSLTAGYMDGALYASGQAASFPQLLHQRMQEAQAGIVFNQPTVGSEQGMGSSQLPDGSPVGKFVFVYPKDCPTAGLVPVPTQGVMLDEYSGDRTAINNLGVPGLRMVDVFVQGYDQANPFYGRFVSSPFLPYGQMVIASKPSFFTLWLGNNDVLGYAIAGGRA